MLGLSIGNYKVTAKIGEGGMGVVYRAVHETLGRPAAVKVLLPQISNSREAVTRFFNEARSATSIRDAGIVDIYDFGFLADQRAYIIMELLEGETLAARLRRSGRMAHARALQIMRSVARALHAAHERGIVHRDMKPDNIFLVPDPEMPTGERIKLLDFGIAKLGGGEQPERSLTQTGMVMGTPAYMAPEQCRGAGAVDRRADIYALGCILYELVCGRPPFVAEGPGDIIAHHLYFAPESPRTLDPGVAEDAAALILSLLAKEPAKRPPTAAHVIAAIDALAMPPLTSNPHQFVAPTLPPTLSTTPPTTISSASVSVGTLHLPSRARRRWLVAGAAAGGAAIAALLLVVLGGDPDARAPTPSDEASGPGATSPAAAGSAATAPSPPDSTASAPAMAAPAAVTSTPAPAAAPAPTTTAAPAATPASTTTAAPAATPAPRATEAGDTRPRPPATSRPPGRRPSGRGSSQPEPAAPEAAAPEPARPRPACSVESFDAVARADRPSEVAVQAALSRLKACENEIPAHVFADLQQQLISKL